MQQQPMMLPGQVMDQGQPQMIQPQYADPIQQGWVGQQPMNQQQGVMNQQQQMNSMQQQGMMMHQGMQMQLPGQMMMQAPAAPKEESMMDKMMMMQMMSNMTAQNQSGMNSGGNGPIIVNNNNNNNNGGGGGGGVSDAEMRAKIQAEAATEAATRAKIEKEMREKMMREATQAKAQAQAQRLMARRQVKFQGKGPVANCGEALTFHLTGEILTIGGNKTCLGSLGDKLPLKSFKVLDIGVCNSLMVKTDKKTTGLINISLKSGKQMQYKLEPFQQNEKLAAAVRLAMADYLVVD